MLQACSFPGGAVGAVSGVLSLLPGAGPQSGGPPNPSRLGPSSSAEIGDWDVSAEGVIRSKGHRSRLSLPLVWQNINKQHPMQCITHWVMARGNEGTPALQGHCGKPPRAMLPECRDISSARGHLASLQSHSTKYGAPPAQNHVCVGRTRLDRPPSAVAAGAVLWGP